MNIAESRLEELLQIARAEDSSEADIQSAVKSLFDALLGDQSARLEVSVDGGKIDILVRNTIVEVKKRADQLGIAPSYVIDQLERRKYAASQLQDYVNARYSNVKTHDENVYHGYTTNGALWYRWRVVVGADEPTQVWNKDLAEMSPKNVEATGLSRTDIRREFLEKLYNDLSILSPPPNDLSQLLSDLPSEAEELALKIDGDSEFDTKFTIWEDLMRGAFIVKPEDRDSSVKLFARHSLLVEMARRVARNVAGSPSDQPHDEASFSSWLNSRGGGGYPSFRAGFFANTAESRGRSLQLATL